jgi:prefoldin beta subunit
MAQQHQIVSTQLQQVQQQVAETQATLEELNKLEKDATVYRSTGGLLIQVKDVEALKKDLAERGEELEVKEKSYSKHEKSLRESVDELKEELSTALNVAQGLGGGT